MAHISPCSKTIMGDKTMSLFLKNVIQLHELFDQITSKGVSQFVSHFLRCLLQTFDTLVNLSLAYHPQTNGQTKWGNQILEQYPRCSINCQQDDWVVYLHLAEFSYKKLIHSSTWYFPFVANIGCHPRWTMNEHQKFLPTLLLRIALVASNKFMLPFSTICIMLKLHTRGLQIVIA